VVVILVRAEGNAVDKAENGPEEVVGPEIVVAVAAGEWESKLF
jgi:hypothetical protein